MIFITVGPIIRLTPSVLDLIPNNINANRVHTDMNPMNTYISTTSNPNSIYPMGRASIPINIVFKIHPIPISISIILIDMDIHPIHVHNHINRVIPFSDNEHFSRCDLAWMIMPKGIQCERHVHSLCVGVHGSSV